MSLRSISKLATCRNSFPLKWQCSLQRCTLPSAWLTPSLSTSSGGFRGAKTKTIIKADDLPQGPLPALPKEYSDDTPIKTYPTTLQQHLINMRKFPHCILLTRVGDFYEMYFDQVDSHAHLVGLKKAKRRTAAGDVAMAGFQHWQLERYLKMFLDLGERVAISEQFPIRENGGAAKNAGPQYDRRVTRVVTPGTLIDESFLNPFENNYLLAIHVEGISDPLPTTKTPDLVRERYRPSTKVGLSWADISSGNFFTQLTDLASLPSLVARIGPNEIVLDASMQSEDTSSLQKLVGDDSYCLHFHQTNNPTAPVTEWSPMLERPIPADQQTLYTLPEIFAGNIILEYIRSRVPNMASQLQPPIRRTEDDYMTIDKQSLRSLEIRTLLRDGTFKGSLLHAIRRTVTKSGARLMSQRIVSPSTSLSIINKRLDLVQQMLRFGALREDVLVLLNRTSDTCRLLQKVASRNKGDADDLLGLARTVEIMYQLSEKLCAHIDANQNDSESETAEMACIQDMLDHLDLNGPNEMAKAVFSAIDEEGLMLRHTREDESREEATSRAGEVVNVDAIEYKTLDDTRRNAKLTTTRLQTSDNDDIWIMRKNASKSLRDAHRHLEELFEQKQELASRLRLQLKTESLTLQWTPKFGHFCHVKGRDIQVDVTKLPGTRSIATTKSTRTFSLEEWSHLGIHMDRAKYRIRSEEDRVLDKLRAQVNENLAKLRRNADTLDELDIACSSAIVAKERNLVRPLLNSSASHRIVGGRHPTVDIGLAEQGQLFTTNACSVGDKEKIYLITGPNMGGKSTYLRQVALITILAQTGCFVPAEYAEIGLVDKIFSRVGSADNLYQDQSTFMVEMLETAEILNQASPRSLVIMDEVGRGTTPEDGIAVGYACLHHLHHVNQSRVLFATHFHKLADMTAGLAGVGYYCTDVLEEKDGSWVYMHRLRAGVNRQSHALKVAKLAGLPEEAIAVARDVLRDLQKGSAVDGIAEQERTPLLAANG